MRRNNALRCAKMEDMVLRARFLLFAIFTCAHFAYAAPPPSDSMAILNYSHQIINLPSAVAKYGTTGKGVSVGIIDTPFNDAHPSLQGKLIDSKLNFEFGRNGDDSLANRDQRRHGSHVAGILLGADLGASNPKGIAPGANFYGFVVNNGALPYNPQDSTQSLSKFFTESGVKIINLSLGRDIYPTINRHGNWQKINSGVTLQNGVLPSASAMFSYLDKLGSNPANFADDVASNPLHVALKEMAKLSAKGVLNVVAAGNEAVVAPNAWGALPSFDESLRAWLVVGNLDARGVTKTGDRFSVSGAQNKYADTSNAFVGAELYGIVAPGTRIVSANAYYSGAVGYDENAKNTIAKDKIGTNGMSAGDAEFYEAGGTSMAAPVVSGAAALVQERFPFLSGAQIADVLLTTANKNISTPKLYVKTGSNILGTSATHNNIIYVKQDDNDDPIPRKDGGIDLEQVARDVAEVLGVSDVNYAKLIIKESLSEKSGLNEGAEGIIALSKEQLFGQGILDVQKALGGLATIDVNRLNAKDIALFEGQTQAFYMLSVEAGEHEFSNDIAQKKWDDKYHISGARNSPKNQYANIANFDAGLVKTGGGALILSGTNTYAGATRVNGGILKIKGEKSKFGSGANGGDALNSTAKGALINSTAYAERGGNLALQNAYLNAGAVASGGIITIEQNARINAATTHALLARNSGEIFLKDSATLFLGDSNTRQNLALESGGILSGNGTIYGNVINQGGILYTGFSKATQEITDSNKLTIKGNYTHEAGAKLLIAFDSKSVLTATTTGADGNEIEQITDIKTSKIEADSLNINGGELTYTPVFAQSGELLKPGQVIKIALDSNLESNLDKFSKVSASSTNTLSFDVLEDKKTLVVASYKQGAFTPTSGNEGVASTLENIRDRENLPQNYANFFAALDALSPEDYKNALDSIEESAPLNALDLGFEEVFSNSIKQLNFIAAPASAPNSVRVAFSKSIASDVFYSLFAKNRGHFVLNATTSRLKHKRYRADAYGGGFGVQSAPSDALSFGVFVDYAKSDLKSAFSRIRRDSFSLGAGALADVGAVDVFGLINFGVGKNASSRQILGESLSGAFESRQLSAQAGISKDFALKGIVLRPSVGLLHSILKQGAFSESGGAFAKNYGAQSHSDTSVFGGASLNGSFDFGRARLDLGVFGFYSWRFNDKIASDSSLVDFTNATLSKQSNISKSSAFVGASSRIVVGNYFVGANVNVEKNKNYTQTTANANLGVSF